MNVLEGHPFAPILATVGIENVVKIWEPTLHERDPLKGAEEICNRNRERVRFLIPQQPSFFSSDPLRFS